MVFTFHATGAPPLTWNAPKKELDSEDDWGFQRYKPSACVNELTEHRFVAVQKLREKKLVSEDGTLEIVTKITREQQSKNVSFDMHQRDEDGEGLACQVRTAIHMYLHISTEPSQPIAVRGVARRFFCGLHSALSGSLHSLS